MKPTPLLPLPLPLVLPLPLPLVLVLLREEGVGVGVAAPALALAFDGAAAFVVLPRLDEGKPPSSASLPALMAPCVALPLPLDAVHA